MDIKCDAGGLKHTILRPWVISEYMKGPRLLFPFLTKVHMSECPLRTVGLQVIRLWSQTDVDSNLCRYFLGKFVFLLLWARKFVKETGLFSSQLERFEDILDQLR